MAVKIDWKDRLIQLYDPMERTLSRRGKRILEVRAFVTRYGAKTDRA